MWSEEGVWLVEVGCGLSRGRCGQHGLREGVWPVRLIFIDFWVAGAEKTTYRYKN